MPPPPFDTTGFLRAATQIGIQAARAMAIAEDLYNQGLISYPRTDNTVYPPSIPLRRTVEMFLESEHSDLAAYTLQGPVKPTRGKKRSTDHPPIHPVGVATRKDLQGNHWKIYDLIVRRFLATLCPPGKVEHLGVKIDLNGETFQARGRRTLDPGWRRVYPFGSSQDVEIPALEEGNMVRVVSLSLKRKETKPPSRYTQGGIIQEMEKLGLGTKSTRHEILQKLYARGYIRGMSITPTKIGSAVVDVLERYAREITEPDMTAELEREMMEIAEGKKGRAEVVMRSRQILSEVLTTLQSHEKEIGHEIRKVLLQENVVGTCECGGTLYIRKSRSGKRFVGCSNYPECRTTYSLPQYGRIEPTGERCPTCGAPVIKVYSKGKKPWVTCINTSCPSKGENT